MIRYAFSIVALCALIGTAQAASPREETNSGTASYLAEALRSCNLATDADARAACKTNARQSEQYVVGRQRLPLNWAQDHWR